MLYRRRGGLAKLRAERPASHATSASSRCLSCDATSRRVSNRSSTAPRARVNERCDSQAAPPVRSRKRPGNRSRPRSRPRLLGRTRQNAARGLRMRAWVQDVQDRFPRVLRKKRVHRYKQRGSKRLDGGLPVDLDFWIRGVLPALPVVRCRARPSHGSRTTQGPDRNAPYTRARRCRGRKSRIDGGQARRCSGLDRSRQ